MISVVLQTHSEQCGMHIVVQSAAVHVGWGTAYLYGVQIFIGANVRHKAALRKHYAAPLSNGKCTLS